MTQQNPEPEPRTVSRCRRPRTPEHAHAIREALPRGEKHYRSKLTEADVRRIRELRAKGHKLKEIAAMYGVSYQNVGYIVNRRRWPHVQ